MNSRVIRTYTKPNACDENVAETSSENFVNKYSLLSAIINYQTRAYVKTSPFQTWQSFSVLFFFWRNLSVLNFIQINITECLLSFEYCTLAYSYLYAAKKYTVYMFCEMAMLNFWQNLKFFSLVVDEKSSCKPRMGLTEQPYKKAELA